MTPLIVFGAGGHARSCLDVIECSNQYKILGLVGQNDDLGKTVSGYPVIGRDDDLDSLWARYPEALAFIAVGQIKSAGARVKLYNRLAALGVNIPAIVSPRAVISKNATLGSGTIVMHGAVVNAGSMIGNNSIVNSLALVEHDAYVGNHSHISTGAILNGSVKVGDRTFVGSGAVIHQGVVIENDVVIAAGSIVSRDVTSGQIILRDHE